MAGIPLYREKILRPEIGLTELLRKNAGGEFWERDEYVPFMYRAIVVAVDAAGGRLENPDGTVSEALESRIPYVDSPGSSGQSFSYVVVPTKGPANPPNSLRARIVTNGLDQFLDDQHLRTFWPLFQNAFVPMPGELAYVVFEDSSFTHGLWLARVPMPFSNITQNSNRALLSDVLQTTAGVPPRASLFSDTPPIQPPAPRQIVKP